MSKLGRIPPPDLKHEEKYPLRAIMPRMVDRVERVLSMPSAYRPKYDQGEEGACTGFSASIQSSIRNHRYYDAFWLYNEAKKIDDWPGEDYEGSSVRAALEVLLNVGHRRVFRGRSLDPNPTEGIHAFRWAKTVDEVRTAISEGEPVVLGIDWPYDYYDPILIGREWWLPPIDGRIAGGHAICCNGASDRRQAVKLVNSWGSSYPLVWLPYDDLQRLIDGLEYPGEAAVVTDR
jgi:hypothetical protein